MNKNLVLPTSFWIELQTILCSEKLKVDELHPEKSFFDSKNISLNQIKF